MGRLTIWPVEGIGEITPGTTLADVIAEQVVGEPNGPLADGDVLVVTQKIVSKAEGRLVQADVTTTRSARAPFIVANFTR